MKTRLFLFLLIILAPGGSAFGQGFRYDSTITSQGTIAGVTNAVVIPASPQIAFCNFPANATPCTNKATTYTSQTLVTPCATSTQIVLTGTSSCVASPDAQDNWGVWVPAGMYSYTITLPGGVNLGPYAVSLLPTNANITLASLTVSGTTTLSGLTNVTNAGDFTGASMAEYFKANVNGCNSLTVFQQFYSASSYNISPITGCVNVPASATKTQATGVIGYAYAGAGASGTPGVGLGGYGIAAINNAHTFGLNSNASDCTTAVCGFNTTSTTLNGFEADCNANNSGSNCTNIIVAGVFNAGSLATGITFGKPLGTKGFFDFGMNFVTGSTDSPSINNAAIFFGPRATGTNQASQGITYVANDAVSGQNVATVQLTAAGNLQHVFSKAGTGISGAAFNFAFQRSGGAFGFPDLTGNGSARVILGDANGVGFTGHLDTAETTAPSGAAGEDRCYGDSTAHALECSYNNGTFGIVPLINRAQTWTAAQTHTAAIIPSSTIGITGTTTSDNANAGAIGEYVSSTIATGSSVTLSTGTTANITSISLTAGDWDVTGAVDFTFGATTSYTNLVGSISTTSATLGAQDSKFDFETPAAVPTAGADSTFPLPLVRVSIGSTTTVFLVAQGTFTVSTLKAYGTIRARRIR